jgi:hypothetical protein
MGVPDRAKATVALEVLEPLIEARAIAAAFRTRAVSRNPGRHNHLSGVCVWWP